MVPPPSFGDLGKASRDLFNKGYNFGFLKLDTTTYTGTGIEFKTNSSHNHATGKFFGGLDLKYKVPKYGLILLEKWNTDNTLGTEITVQDQLLKGSKLVFETQFSPNVGYVVLKDFEETDSKMLFVSVAGNPIRSKRSGKIKSEYQQENVHLNTDVTLDSAGPLITSSGVVGYEGWLGGAQAVFDTGRKKLNNYSLAIAYRVPNYVFHTFAQLISWPPHTTSNDGSEFGGSVYHKVNRDLEIAANLGWTTGDQTTRFGLAGKYQIDEDLSLSGKISNTSQVGVALAQALKPGLKLTLSALVNLQNLNDGNHKFGLGIEYEAVSQINRK